MSLQYNTFIYSHYKNLHYTRSKIVKNSPSAHHRTFLSGSVFATKDVSTIGKNFLNSSISSTCPYNMVNLGPLAAEIGSLVWGTSANFSGFRIFAALLHSTLVLGVSQTLRRWTGGATYIRQVGHHVGHWPTFCLPLNCCHLQDTGSICQWLAWVIHWDLDVYLELFMWSLLRLICVSVILD